MYNLTNKQARQFLLYRHGLIGKRRFSGKSGILDFVDMVGCIQFDPIDVCGRNADLVLQSRIQNYRPEMLYDLLYKERSLVDYFDKCLAILPAQEWRYFSRERNRHKQYGRSHDEVKQVSEQIFAEIRRRGPLSSSDLQMDEVVNWYWSDTRLGRAALETLYFSGDLVIHHKKGTRKFYDLAENCLTAEVLNEPDPFPHTEQGDYAHLKWRALRRIGAVGLMWNRASDAWINLRDLKADSRSRIFSDLLAEGEIIEVAVEGIKDMLYCRSRDAEMIEYILQSPTLAKRCELIAPLDNFIWDRKLIAALFGFDYTWEIYTPAAKRKYGYYVLPLVYGENFVGRVEAVRDKDRLLVKNIWFEDGVRQTKALKSAIDKCLLRFAGFNGCGEVSLIRKLGDKATAI